MVVVRPNINMQMSFVGKFYAGGVGGGEVGSVPVAVVVALVVVYMYLIVAFRTDG